MLRPTIAAGLVGLVLAGAMVRAGQSAPASTRISYDEFMSLRADERESRIPQMDVADRLALKRTHAARWLEKNRASLTASQVAVVQEAIDFISPERYRDMRDPELMKQESEIAHRLACSLGEERAVAAFTFRENAPSGHRTWSSLLDSWAQWLVECVAP